MHPGIFARYALDRRLDHRGLARHREQRRVRSSRQERLKRLQEVCVSLFTDGSLRHEGHAQRKASTRREYPLLWAQAETLCKKKAELQTSLTLIATLWKQEKISGACLENLSLATMSCPENNCMYRKSHHSQ